MTCKQIEYLIRIHESQRDFAKTYLDTHYYELEETDNETEWLERYIYHERVVEQLKQERADDE